MSISIDTSSLKEIRPHEYVLRFIFGGLVTLLTGLIAQRFGPSIAGLFLAFPAIFPATATLIEKHEKQRKQQIGLDGTNRGRSAVAVDAAGTALGTLGLLLFALFLWKFLPTHSATLILTAAALIWIATAIAFWKLHQLV
jgi:hypothetical protein